MSNERIDEILTENNLVFESIIAKERIYRSMQQYGAERYQGGQMDQEKVEDFKLGLQLEELKRLKALVQAQKELIALYDEENLSDLAWLKESELRNKIKTLEQ